MTERESAERSLTVAQWAALRERYPDQNIVIEHDGQKWCLYADDEEIARALLLSDAYREALKR